MSEKSQRVLPYRVTEDGWHILRVHWSSVPGFDYESACVGRSENDIARELEIDWSQARGLRVYPEFAEARHVATEPLPFDPELPLHVGIDCPGCPAAVISQVNKHGQWLIYESLAPEPEELRSFYEFGERLAERLQNNYATPHRLGLADLRLVFVGDPAGAEAAPTGKGDKAEKRSCFEILRQGVKLFVGQDDDGDPIYQPKPGWGWNVIPGEVTLKRRLEAVKSRLTTLVGEGLPALLLDPREEFLRTAFLGAYHYHQYSDGSYSRDPEKDHPSHAMNAMEYAATRLWTQATSRRDEEDEDRPRREPFRSQSAGRYY